MASTPEDAVFLDWLQLKDRRGQAYFLGVMFGITLLTVAAYLRPRESYGPLSAICFVSWAGMLIIGRANSSLYRKTLAGIHADHVKHGARMSRAEKLLGVICLISAAYQIYKYLSY